MKCPRVNSVVLTICFCLAGFTAGHAQTTSPAGRFGLPGARNTNVQTVPGTAPASPITSPTPSAIPTPAPGSAAATSNNLLTQVKFVNVTIVAAKQGTIANGILVDKYQYQPAAKAMNGPVTFTKKWDRTTISLMNALQNNELLTSVTFQFCALNGTALYTVTLTNASIASINQSVDGASALPMEDIHLIYQTIEIKDSATPPNVVASKF